MDYGSAALDIDTLARPAQEAADTLLAHATAAVRRTVTRDGKLDSALLEAEQRAVHGLAWLATYAESVRQLVAYAERMKAEGRFGETEALLTQIGLSEFLAQMFSGIPMNQGEIVRPADFGLDEAAIAPLRGAVAELIATGNTPALRARLVELIQHAPAGCIGDPGLD